MSRYLKFFNMLESREPLEDQECFCLSWRLQLILQMCFWILIFATSSSEDTKKSTFSLWKKIGKLPKSSFPTKLIRLFWLKSRTKSKGDLPLKNLVQLSSHSIKRLGKVSLQTIMGIKVKATQMVFKQFKSIRKQKSRYFRVWKR